MEFNWIEKMWEFAWEIEEGIYTQIEKIGRYININIYLSPIWDQSLRDGMGNIKLFFGSLLCTKGRYFS